jgi:hypothetical protein
MTWFEKSPPIHTKLINGCPFLVTKPRMIVWKGLFGHMSFAVPSVRLKHSPLS